MLNIESQLSGKAEAASVNGSDDTAATSRQHRFDFPALCPELRNLVYSEFILPATTITKLYPPRATDSISPVPALAYASHEIGRESMPIIHKDVDLVLRPQQGFALVAIPRGLMRAMPDFARYVNTLTVELVFRAPPLPITGNSAPLDILMKFEMGGKKTFKITASADDPTTANGREKILDSAEKMATEMKAVLVGYLKKDAILNEKLVEAEGVQFFTWTQWVSPYGL